jgi:hypothetical protein
VIEWFKAHSSWFWNRYLKLIFSAICLITPDGEGIQASPVREICTLGLMRRGLETSLRFG